MAKDKSIKVDVAAGVILRKEEKYLLVQEKKEAVYGLWNLPAGKVDEGETFEEAATREAKEESGYNVKILREVALFHSEPTGSIRHFFEAEIVGGELKIGVGMLDTKWFTYEEIGKLGDKLRDKNIIDAINILESK